MIAEVKVEIASVDRTEFVAVESGSLRSEHGSPTTLDLTIHDRGRGYRPRTGDAIRLYLDGTLTFAGHIWRSVARVNEARLLEYRLQCVDHRYIAARRLIVASFGEISLIDAANIIVSMVLREEGVTLHPDIPVVTVPGRIDAYYDPIASVLDNIADLLGYYWTIDDQKRLYIGPWQPLSPPIVITDIDCHAFEVEYTREGYRNRQYVRSEAIPAGSFGDEYIYVEYHPQFGTVPYYGFGTRAAVNHVRLIEVNGTERTIIAIDPADLIGQTNWSPPTSGADFWYFIGGIGIQMLDYQPQVDDIIHVVYDPGAPFEWMIAGAKWKVVSRELAGEIADRTAAEGGSGIWEAVEEAPQAATVASMEAIAAARLAAYGRDDAVIRLSTGRPLALGQQVRIISAAHGLDDDYIVDAVELRLRGVLPAGSASVRYEVRLARAPRRGAIQALRGLSEVARRGGGGPHRALAAPQQVWRGGYLIRAVSRPPGEAEQREEVAPGRYWTLWTYSPPAGLLYDRLAYYGPPATTGA